MATPQGSTCRIESRDRTTVVELGLDSRAVSISYSDPALPGTMSFQTAITDTDWAALKQAAFAPSGPTDERRLRLEQFAERARLPARATARRLVEAARWLLTSGEKTNHTYLLGDLCKVYLAHTVAAATGVSAAAAAGYIAEAENDAALANHVRVTRAAQPADLRATSDAEVRFGRRLGWYAVVRALKPRLVVETGVDKGLGGVLLCAALLRNAGEGHAGRYIGTDINPRAGYLLSGAYQDVGGVVYGDSLTSLAALKGEVGVFINDSDHNPDYEAQEYAAITPRLAKGAVILSDNAHATGVLADFAAARGQRFLFWREQPAGHWYPGAGIGFAFD